MNVNFGIMPYIVIIILLLISIIILIIIILTNKKIKKNEDALDDDTFRKEVNLINDKILELNDHYNFINGQLDAKQKELLFLYQMISLKQEELLSNSKKIDGKFDSNSDIITEEVCERKVNEFNEMVLNLHEEGYGVDEIARKLARGKGEVSLALKIYSK